MKINYCVGICPFCSNQGLIFPIRNGRKVSFICDESFHIFDTFEDITKKVPQIDIEMRDDYMELEEFLEEMPYMVEEVFVLENGDWCNLKDKNKTLF